MAQSRYDGQVEDALHLNPMMGKQPSTATERLSEALLSKSGKPIRDEINKLAGENAQFIHEDNVARLSVGIFVEQLAVHLLFPLSVPYIYQKYGPQAPVNQLFYGENQTWLFAFINHLYWVLPVVFLVMRKELNEGGITDDEFLCVMFGGLVYRAVVASKYASLTDAEYLRYLQVGPQHRAMGSSCAGAYVYFAPSGDHVNCAVQCLMHCVTRCNVPRASPVACNARRAPVRSQEPDRDVSSRLRTQLQLVTGWLNLDLPRMVRD